MQTKLLHIKNGYVAAVSLPGENVNLIYGEIVEVPFETEIGVGEPDPRVPAEAAEAAAEPVTEIARPARTKKAAEPAAE